MFSDFTLFYAVCQCNFKPSIDIARMLLDDMRFDANMQDTYGNTPFHYACREGHLDLIKVMVESDRIDLNKLNHKEETPFYSARAIILNMVLLNF